MKTKLLLIIILLSLFRIETFSQSKERVPTVAFKQKGAWHVWDQYGKSMFKPLNMVMITGYSEGFFTVQKAFGKDTIWGFLSLDGKFALIEGAKYLGIFKNGMAHYARWNKGTEDLKYFGYVRNDGTTITPPIYLEATYFGDDGLAFVMNWEKRGYIDREGKMVQPFQQGFGEVFSNGLAVVQDSAGRFGYIDKRFMQSIPLIYDEAHNFSEGYARVNKKGFFGFIDSTGIDMIPTIFVLATDFKEGRAFVAMAESIASLHWAIISKGGKFVTDYIYDQVNDFSQGIASVKKDGVWFFVDIWGNKIIDKDFKTCDSFVDGLAWASELRGKNRRGFVDITGKYQFTLPKDATDIIDLRLNKAVE